TGRQSAPEPPAFLIHTRLLFAITTYTLFRTAPILLTAFCHLSFCILCKTRCSSRQARTLQPRQCIVLVDAYPHYNVYPEIKCSLGTMSHSPRTWPGEYANPSTSRHSSAT